MDKMAGEIVLQSEEDLQRMIELGAWYDGDEESNLATVEADSETETIYNRNEVIVTALSIHIHLYCSRRSSINHLLLCTVSMRP